MEKIANWSKNSTLLLVVITNTGCLPDICGRTIDPDPAILAHPVHGGVRTVALVALIVIVESLCLADTSTANCTRAHGTLNSFVVNEVSVAACALLLLVGPFERVVEDSRAFIELTPPALLELTREVCLAKLDVVVVWKHFHFLSRFLGFLFFGFFDLFVLRVFGEELDFDQFLSELLEFRVLDTDELLVGEDVELKAVRLLQRIVEL